MKQRETSASINGTDHKVVYRAVQTDEGVVYEGLLGKLAFRFSRNQDKMIYSDSLIDITVRKPVIAAVLDNEDSLLD